MKISPMKIHQAPLKVVLLHVHHFGHYQRPQSGPQFAILLGTDDHLLTALGICIHSLSFLSSVRGFYWTLSAPGLTATSLSLPHIKLSAKWSSADSSAPL